MRVHLLLCFPGHTCRPDLTLETVLRASLACWQVFEKWKSDVVTLERIMLRAFGFILHVEHPHKFVLNYLVVLEQHDHPESGLLQRAWNLANDRYSSHAAAAVEYSCYSSTCTCR